MKVKKIIAILILIVTCLCSNYVFASFNINKADLYSKGKCKALLKMKSNGGEIIVTKVVYKNNGKENPAYCINVELDGVGEHGNYSVSIDGAVNNPLVWRAITNGYPYKSLESLGVKDEDEAYTATKQAVYCVLYNYDVSRYEPIGEAGQRTLNALKQIVKVAREGKNVKPSNSIKIESDGKWEIDNNRKEYISQKFKITTECNAREFEIAVSDLNSKNEKTNDNNKILLCDMDGNEITKTTKKEFKVLVPIYKLEKDGKISINVKAQLETKPVLFGNSNNVNLQNYAITGEMYEGGEGNLQVSYGRNTNKLTLVKVGQVDGKKLKGVEFNILDENGNIKYSNLVTNENGEVSLSGIFPGKYYLEETKTIDGYTKLENKVEFEIKLNEELKITVENTPKKEVQNQETIQNQKKISERKIERLPVTGM